jgi:Zn-dependent peptidase ImmA (M78 family)
MDTSTRCEIERIAAKILKEARLVNPPIQIEEVLEHLSVHRRFYDLEDPGLLERFAHKLRIGSQRIYRIVRKIKLAAIWAPDEDEILIDKSQPAPKQLWASFHDATHRMLPWHRDFFLGDTAQSLEPFYQDALEEEANAGASALMFGPRFTEQAQELPTGWAAIEQLKKIHKKSYVTVLRRYVEHGPDQLLAGIVSTAHWDPKPADQITRCRHFVRSQRFAGIFQAVTGDELLAQINSNTRMRRGGPVGTFQVVLRDTVGKNHEFLGESFYNRHYVLTLFSAPGG